MKKYYLHNGTESSGPFDIEELKAKNITKQTPVWFEGMEKWKTAAEIEELKSVFVVIPPTVNPFTASAPGGPTNKLEEEIEEEIEEESLILGLSKTTFIIVCAVLIFIGGSLYINNLQQKRSKELEQKNHKTEIENYQLELKQKELEEQKIQEIIQQKIDSERIAREKKQITSRRISEIDRKLADYQNNIYATEKKLNNTSGFKLLRSAAEKEKQMNLLQKSIDSFKNEMTKLKAESDQLKLELEKIK
ncbi:MAG: GYF domain-containing protein [Bacteroidota bacterium]